MKPWLRHSAGILLLTGLWTVFWMPGCGKQGEGERCDFTRGGDADCESGLVCVLKSDLVNGDADRCCPKGTPTDDRCLPAVSGIGGSDGGGGDTGVDGVAGGGGTAGAATDGSSDVSVEGGDATADATDAAESGIACQYSSECPGTLVCGPTGICQAECLGPKDCPSGETCVAQVCQPLSVDSGAD